MLRTLSSVLVLVIVSSLMMALPVSASAQGTEDTKQAEKIKGRVAVFGEGERVSVKLRDKKKITGDINYIGQDSFTMTDAKTKTSHKLSYSDVVQVDRKKEGGFPTWAKVTLGVIGVLWVIGMISNGGG